MLTPSLVTLDVNENINNIESIFSHLVINQKRGRQKTIGASELGTACIKCLTLKLAKIPTVKTFNYPAWQGTAQHLWLEKHFKAYDKERFKTEKRVKITRLIDGSTVWGNIDLYDTANRMCVDWKFLGESTLKKYSKNISQQYEVQAQLYGYGLNHSGEQCDVVSLCMFPRTSSNFSDRKWWWNLYDEDKATEFIDRANQILKETETARQQLRKNNDLLGFIEYAEREFSTSSGCFSCRNYGMLKTALTTK